MIFAPGNTYIDFVSSALAQTDIPRAFDSYASVASDPEVDVIYIGALNPAHLDLCKMVINAGKNVLCEKPLAMNVWQTKEILELAKEKGEGRGQLLLSRGVAKVKKIMYLLVHFF